MGILLVYRGYVLGSSRVYIRIMEKLLKENENYYSAYIVEIAVMKVQGLGCKCDRVSQLQGFRAEFECGGS